MATIRKRGSRWQAQVRRKGYPPSSRSFINREDALRWAREQELAIDRGEWCKPLQVCIENLSALLDRYEAEFTPGKRSKSDHFHLRQIKRHAIGSCPIRTLTPDKVAQFRDDRLRVVSGATVRKELALLGSVLKIARNEWGITLTNDPVTPVRKPPAAKGRTRRTTKAELTALDDALRLCRNGLVRPVFMFALATGMKRGEVLSLTWVNINEADRTALLPLTKNGEARAVPLSPSALQVIVVRRDACQQTPEGRREPLVFPISANAFRLAWERVKRRAGVVDLRFHDLRHEAISRFFELGLSVPEVALISGHRDSRMLFRYTHLRAEKIAEKLKTSDRSNHEC
jgi:integrase